MHRPASASGRHFTICLILEVIFLALCATAYTPLSDAFLRIVPSGGEDFATSHGSLLAPLLTPRVPGTAGQSAAQHHFVNFFQTALPRWKLEWQNSTSKTPASGSQPVSFSNLIFRREPPWTQPGQANFLTLAAHYDSRASPAGFVGAANSAASCAVLMHVARAVDRYVQQMYDEMQELGEGGTVAMDVGVQVVFVDGKEGFGAQPGGADSLYGSRSLAASWEQATNPAMSEYGYPNSLNQISMFILLDGLGSAGARVPSYFQTSHWAYRNMAAIERRLRWESLVETHPAGPFLSEADKNNLGFWAPAARNDHVPFLDRGVPVLALVPQGQVAEGLDDGEQLDVSAVRDWARIVTAFVMEWLDMMEVAPVKEGAARRT